MKIASIILITVLLSSIFQSHAPVDETNLTNYIVTKTTDSNDGICDADCSLREAIIASNNAGGENIIYLPSGTYTMTIEGANENYAATGDFDIRSNIQINGDGKDLTIIDGNAIDRIFEIISSVTVTISDLTLMNGYVDGQGGAIKNNGMLTITHSNIQNNVSSAQGGGVMSQGNAQLTILESTISNNSTSQDGGGVFNSATLTILSTTLTNNQAESTGAGITNRGGVVTIEKSTISYNQARSGGGIDSKSLTGLADAYLTIRNSTISGNGSTSGGGGINATGYTTLNNTTMTLNHSSTGGGLYGAATASNTIIAGNTADTWGSDCEGTITSLGHNLIEEPIGCVIEGDITGNIYGHSPNIGPLENNGGLTDTHALIGYSPAENAGSPETPGSSPSACESTDQRDITRPQGRQCDIGAYERVRPILVINYVSGQPGSFFNLQGQNYPANELATVTINGHEIVDDLVIDGSGSFIFTLDTQLASPGIYNVTVSADPSVSVRYVLDPLEPMRDQEGEYRVIMVPGGIAYIYSIYIPMSFR